MKKGILKKGFIIGIIISLFVGAISVPSIRINKILNQNEKQSYDHDVGIISIEPNQDLPGQTLPVQATIKNFGQYEECCISIDISIGEPYEIGTMFLEDDWPGSIYYPGQNNGWQDEHDNIYYYYGWRKSYSAYAGGSPYEACLPGYYAFEDYHFYSPAIDASDYSMYRLRFKSYINHSYERGKYSLEAGYSTDANNWITAWQVEPCFSQNFIVDVPIIGGSETMYIGFWVKGDPTCFNYWFIDDVELYALGFTPEYTDSAYLDDIDPLEEVTFQFDDWTPVFLAEETTGTRDYIIEASIEMDNDTNPYNDIKTEQFILDYWHDVGVVEITSPETDTMILPGTQSIDAIVGNYGTFQETDLTAYAKIWEFITDPENGTLVYTDEISDIDLLTPLGGELELHFDDFTFSEFGRYELSICILSGNDDYPDNNCITKTISVNQILISTNIQSYRVGEEIAITVKNIGDEVVHFSVFPKIEIFNEFGEKVYPLKNETGSWTLQPDESEIYIWDQTVKNGPDINEQDALPGLYTSQPSNNDLSSESEEKIVINDIGYVILVGGAAPPFRSIRTWQGSYEIYKDLISMGFDDERIYYLHNHLKPKNDEATKGNIQKAIEVWAKDGRVSAYSPLYIILFGHGCKNLFETNSYFGNYLKASELESWIQNLLDKYKEPKPRIDVWMMSCYSGSFIDELSKLVSITTTSNCADKESPWGVKYYWEIFTADYWPKMVDGSSWLDAFNYACYHSHKAQPKSIFPLLDDDEEGKGVGHGRWVHCTGAEIKDLPHSGDGNIAKDRYMGKYQKSSIGHYLHWDLICPSRFIPSGNDSITIWALIDKNVEFENTSAGIIDPDFIPCGGNDTIPIEYFNMTDNNDGNWTVTIPYNEFSDYNATNFTILIRGQTNTNESISPLHTNIFLSGAFPDNEKPFISIDNPREGQIVNGILQIKGLASDNIKIEDINIYFDDNEIANITPPSSCHYYFNTSLDTTKYSNGLHTLKFEVYDKAGNKTVLLREIFIVGAPYKPDTPDGPIKVTRNKEYDYTTRCFDPQEDQVYYRFEWKEDEEVENSIWFGPYDSGETCTASLKFNTTGTYSLTVKAKDINGKISVKSDSLEVIVPRNKAFVFNFNLLSGLIEQFPHAFLF